MRYFSPLLLYCAKGVIYYLDTQKGGDDMWKKVWEFLKIVGEVIADMPQAEMQYRIRKSAAKRDNYSRYEED